MDHSRVAAELRRILLRDRPTSVSDDELLSISEDTLLRAWIELRLAMREFVRVLVDALISSLSRLRGKVD